LSAHARYSIGQVFKKDGSPLERGVPEYLVETLGHDIEALDLDSSDVQLVDFGSGTYLAINHCSFLGTDHGTCYSLLCLEPADGDTYSPLTTSPGVGL
jgi:hypothetical protein